MNYVKAKYIWETAPWSTIPTSLNPDEAFAVGYNNQSNLIYLLGIERCASFNVDAWNKPQPFNSVAFSGDVPIESQTYVQNDNILYIFNNGFLTFDLSTTNTSKIKVAPPIGIWYGICVSFLDGLLIVSGGKDSTNYNAMNTIQAFNIATQKWSVNMFPNMTRPRVFHSCSVSVKNELYQIGGTGNTVEKLVNQKWMILNDTLQTGTSYTSSVTRGIYIYVIGGFDHYLGIVKGVDIIDTITDTIYANIYALSIAVWSTTPIIVDDRIYIFGGTNTSTNTNYWQYYTFSAVEPTPPPTKSPTKPTKSPTNSPSISPTRSPSNSPSKSPSDSPTKTPSISPSDAPSRLPTTPNRPSKNNGNGVDIIMLMFGVVIGTAVSICFIGIFVYCKRKRIRRREQNLITTASLNAECESMFGR